MKSTQLGNMVKEHRKAAGLSQQELARLAGVGKTAVFDIEKGKASIQFNTLMSVLDVLNIKVELITPLTHNKGDAQ